MEDQGANNLRDSLENIASILTSPQSGLFFEEFVNLLTDEQSEELIVMMREKKTKDNGDRLIYKMPSEMWIKVLEFLDPKDLCSLSSTCKSFKDLSRDKSLWKQTSWTVSPQDLLQYPESYGMLFKRLDKLKCLSITRDYEDGGLDTQIERKSKQKLKSSFLDVKIQEFEIRKLCRNHAETVEYKQHLDVFVSLFSNLTTINFGANTIHDSHLEVIANTSKELKYFTSDSAIELTDRGVVNLVSKCPNLKFIRFFAMEQNLLTRQSRRLVSIVAI